MNISIGCIKYIKLKKMDWKLSFIRKNEVKPVLQLEIDAHFGHTIAQHRAVLNRKITKIRKSCSK